MDSKQYGEYDMEDVRERIESKQDEFAGGPEPGWERLEDAASEANRQTLTETASRMGETSDTGSTGTVTATTAPAGGIDTTSTSDGTSAGGISGDGISGGGATSGMTLETETRPAGGARPMSQSQGTSSTTATPASGSSGTPMSSTSMSSASTEQAPADPHLEPDDMERVTPEHPLGVGQQCFKCGAYNDLDAETCWSCSQPLTETPAATESTDTQSQADTSLPTNDQSQMGAGVLAESQPQIGGIMDTTMSEDTLETEDRPES